MNIKNRLRKIYFSIARIPFEHKEISLISNNCLAGCILHDFGLRFDTPTINLFIPFPDYIKFLSDLKGFVNKEIVDITNGSNYPIGLLGGQIHIHFLHYKTFEEGVDAWKRRSERIHWNKLYVVLAERDGCSENDLRAFEELPYKRKIALVHKSYPFLRNFCVIKGFETDKELGNIMTFKNSLGMKHYDEFSWKRFLTQE